MQFFKWGFLVAFALLLVVGRVQAQTEMPIAAPGWSGMITTGPNQWNTSAKFSTGINNHGMSGQPFAFDNGHPVGSPMNSGIFSTAVPQGGPVNLDTSSFSSSLGPAFKKGFTWVLWGAFGVVFTVVGLVLGAKLVSGLTVEH